MKSSSFVRDAAGKFQIIIHTWSRVGAGAEITNDRQWSLSSRGGDKSKRISIMLNKIILLVTDLITWTVIKCLNITFPLLVWFSHLPSLDLPFRIWKHFPLLRYYLFATRKLATSREFCTPDHCRRLHSSHQNIKIFIIECSVCFIKSQPVTVTSWRVETARLKSKLQCD